MKSTVMLVTSVAALVLPLGSLFAQAGTNVPPRASMDRQNAARHYPDKPIRLIVPIAPGGGADILARIVGQKLSESFGRQVVIDNRPGAGSMIGTDIAAKAAADGYTLVLVFSTLAINVSLYSKTPFDPVKDFAPVTLMASAPYFLLLHPSVPATSVRELIALAKSRPGQLNYASGGNGSPNHLAAELFKSMAKVDITHVPYSGGGPGFAALLSGQVQLTFITTATALPYMKSGRVVALGVGSAQRSRLAPDVPTIAEAGLPGYDADVWFGILAPARTPAAIIARLDREIKSALQLPDVQKRLSDLGYDRIESTPEKFAAFIREEIRKWARVVKESGARID